MARAAERLSENVPGPFFVDSTCIDCGACRIVAPRHFRRGGSGLSIVHRQPETEAERTRALMALVACPTSSIGTEPRRDATPGVAAFPERLPAEEVPVEGWEQACAGLPLDHMGRGPAEDPAFFAAAFAAGRLARRLAER